MSNRTLVQRIGRSPLVCALAAISMAAPGCSGGANSESVGTSQDSLLTSPTRPPGKAGATPTGPTGTKVVTPIAVMHAGNYVTDQYVARFVTPGATLIGWTGCDEQSRTDNVCTFQFSELRATGKAFTFFVTEETGCSAGQAFCVKSFVASARFAITPGSWNRLTKRWVNETRVNLTTRFVDPVTRAVTYSEIDAGRTISEFAIAGKPVLVTGYSALGSVVYVEDHRLGRAPLDYTSNPLCSLAAGAGILSLEYTALWGLTGASSAAALGGVITTATSATATGMYVGGALVMLVGTVSAVVLVPTVAIGFGLAAYAGSQYLCNQVVPEPPPGGGTPPGVTPPGTIDPPDELPSAEPPACAADDVVEHTVACGTEDYSYQESPHTFVIGVRTVYCTERLCCDGTPPMGCRHIP